MEIPIDVLTALALYLNKQTNWKLIVADFILLTLAATLHTAQLQKDQRVKTQNS